MSTIMQKGNAQIRVTSKREMEKLISQGYKAYNFGTSKDNKSNTDNTDKK